MGARWITNFRVFLVWLLGFGLTLVILALLHELFMLFIVNTLQWGRYVVRFLNILYYFPAGIVCIAYLIFSYPYFGHTARNGQLLRITMQMFGIQLLAIGLIQLGLIGYRFLPAVGINFLMVFGEALVGIVLIALSWRGRKTHFE